MVLINETGFMYSVLAGMTTNVTGSWFLTFLSLTLIIYILGLVFGLDIEFTTILVFPLLIIFGGLTGEYLSVLAIGIIYFAVLFAKNFFIYR